ncbi:MAG: MarR family winged helix-turn-helix transcriptional regulator [Pleomorphochaeta sp.]
MDKVKTLSLLQDCITLLSQKKLPVNKKSENRDERKFNHNQRKMLGLIRNNNEINQRKLASLMKISPQAISKGLKKLEENNYIIRTNGNQKNENLIYLTADGKKIADNLDLVINHHAKELFSNFSDEEVENLYYLLNKVIDNQSKIISK